MKILSIAALVLIATIQLTNIPQCFGDGPPTQAEIEDFKVKYQKLNSESEKMQLCIDAINRGRFSVTRGRLT